MKAYSVCYSDEFYNYQCGPTLFSVRSFKSIQKPNFHLSRSDHVSLNYFSLNGKSQTV